MSEKEFSQKNPDGYVSYREFSQSLLKFERRMTKVEVLVSLQVVLLTITILKMFLVS